MRKAILINCLLFLYMSGFAQQKVDSNFHLYLLIGQSNMAGRGEIDSESKAINPQIWMLDSLNHWVTATDPVHFDKPSAAVGPAISFAKTILGDNKKIRIGLIPCAWGGSPIKAWEHGAEYINNSHPYDDAIARTRIAMQQGVLKGILWHQGESDNDSARAPLYMGKLKTLVNRFRNEFKSPSLPFVAGEIGHFNKVDFINPVIRQLPQHISNTAVVSAEGLTDKGDKLHFNTTAARELGKRYAIAIQKLTTRK
jgi:hypothetical protein